MKTVPRGLALRLWLVDWILVLSRERERERDAEGRSGERDMWGLCHEERGAVAHRPLSAILLGAR